MSRLRMSRSIAKSQAKSGAVIALGLLILTPAGCAVDGVGYGGGGDMAADTVTAQIITNPMVSGTAAGATVIMSDPTAMAAIVVATGAAMAGAMPSEPDRQAAPHPLSPQVHAAEEATRVAVAAMAAAVTDGKLSVIACMMPDLAAKNPIGPCGIEQYYRQQDKRSDQ